MAYRRGFKRRRPRVVWLPVFGNSIAPENAYQTNGYDEQQIEITTDGIPSLDYFPLTWDADTSEEQIAALGFGGYTLQDIVSGNAYRLRRIVGSLQLAWGTPRNGAETPISAVKVGAGLIVLRTTDGTGTPTGLASPLKQDHATFPWIWHRTWILGKGTGINNTQATPGIEVGWYVNPVSNVYFARGRNDEIDQKTARTISNNERLFLAVSAHRIGINTNIAGQGSAVLAVNFHYRLLGSLKMQQGNRNNSSR